MSTRPPRPPTILKSGTHGCIVRPAIFSRTFREEHPALEPNNYVTKIFFAQHSYDDEQAVHGRLKLVFADHTDLCLPSFADTLETEADAGRESVLADMREMYQWDHDTDEVTPSILHYPFAGTDLKSSTPGAGDIVHVLRTLFRTVAVLNGGMCIHRDIKLENVLWDHRTGAVHLIDYGVAEFVDLEDPEFPAYDNWKDAYYEPPETVLNIGQRKLLHLFKYLRGNDRVEPSASRILDRLVSQHALSLLGLTKSRGSQLEGALARAGMFPGADESFRVGQKRPAPGQTRQTLLAEETAEAVRQLEGRYKQVMHTEGDQKQKAGIMADIVRAYNAFQVGYLLRSLIARIQPGADDSDTPPVPVRTLQGWADHLLHLNMDERIRGWDAIARQLNVLENGD